MEKPNDVGNEKLDVYDVDEEQVIGGGGESGAGGVPDGDLSAGDGVFAKMQRYVGSIGVEKRGIERVPDTVEERTDTSMSKVGTVVGFVCWIYPTGNRDLTYLTTVALLHDVRGVLWDRHHRTACIRPGICGLGTRHPVFQHPWRAPHIVLLNLWAGVWSSTVGPVEVLLWMVRREDL